MKRIALVLLLSALAAGCQAKDTPTASSKTTETNQLEGAQPEMTPNPALPTSSQELSIPLRQGMDYDLASGKLLEAGWQKTAREEEIMDDSPVKVDPCTLGSQWLSCKKYPELDGCGHVCEMYYKDAVGRRLRVATTTPEVENGKITVESWDIESDSAP